MKTKALLVLMPFAAVAVGSYAWAPEGPGDTGNSDPVNEVGTTASIPGEIAATPLRSAADSASAPSTMVAKERHEAGCDLTTRYLPNDDGTVIEVYSCESLTTAPPHPYESYPSDSLAALAYSDAMAAEILGMRLRESDEARSLSLILRASALAGGDTAPVLRYYSAYPHPLAIDGVPVRTTVHMKFVLSAVVDLLDGNTQSVVPWETYIRLVSTNPEKEIAVLHRRAQEIVEQMRHIELEVMGSSSIGGQGDA